MICRRFYMELHKMEEIVKASFFLSKDKENKLSPELTAKMWINEFWFMTIFTMLLGLVFLSAGIQQVVGGFRHHPNTNWGSVGFGFVLYVVFLGMCGMLYYFNNKRVKKGRVFPRNQEKTIENAKELIRYYEFLLEEAKILDEKWKQSSA